MILVISSKNSYAMTRLQEEAKQTGVPLEVLSMEDLINRKFNVDIKKYSALYIRNPYIKNGPEFLPNVILLAKKFHAAHKKVVDVAIVKGDLGKGKWVDYKKMMKVLLPIPGTMNLESRILNLEYPLILKWQFGMKAKNVFLVRSKQELNNILPLHPKSEWLVQEYIKADYEYKVITVGYKALPVILRFKILPGGFRPDFQSYKTVKKSSVPKVGALAERASKVLGRELAKVDILQRGRQLYVLEVNRTPGLDSFEPQTKFNVAKEFLSYLQK